METIDVALETASAEFIPSFPQGAGVRLKTKLAGQSRNAADSRHRRLISPATQREGCVGLIKALKGCPIRPEGQAVCDCSRRRYLRLMVQPKDLKSPSSNRWRPSRRASGLLACARQPQTARAAQPGGKGVDVHPSSKQSGEPRYLCSLRGRERGRGAGCHRLRAARSPWADNSRGSILCA